MIVYRANESTPQSQSIIEETSSKSEVNEITDNSNCPTGSGNARVSHSSTNPWSLSQVSPNLPQLPLLTTNHCSMDEVLQLLRQLYIISTQTSKGRSEMPHTKTDQEKNETQLEDDRALGMHTILDLFNSQKITNKLVQQIQDPLVLSANAMPDWCQELTFSCPMLFPFETRLLHFHCTAFGASRR